MAIYLKIDLSSSIPSGTKWNEHGLIFNVSLRTILELIALGALSGSSAELVVCVQAEWLKTLAVVLSCAAFWRICTSVRTIVEERGVA